VYPLQRNPLARARYHSARRILAVSHFVARSVAASGLAADRVEVVHDGVELPPAQTPETRRQARKRWDANEQEVLLGCVGVLLPSKGQEFLVRSAPLLRAEFPSCRLLLAGEGPCCEQLAVLARQLGVQKAVELTGFVEQIDQLYSALDIFLFPALSEGLSTSLLRAMAHGLPVIALEQEAAPEAIENGRTGLLLSDREPQTIVAAARRLLRDQQYALNLGAAARETIEQRFTADHMVENTLRVYESLMPPGVPS
jgi:glycosyltransferase involved in cell wall biosynthesis